MSNQWYCQILGQVWGPMPFEELAGMVRQGTLSPGDLVRPDRTEAWQRAGSLPGLAWTEDGTASGKATAHAAETITAHAAVPQVSGSPVPPVVTGSPNQTSVVEGTALGQGRLAVSPDAAASDSTDSARPTAVGGNSLEWRSAVRAALEQRRWRSNRRRRRGNATNSDEHEAPGRPGLADLLYTGWFYFVSAFLVTGHLLLQGGFWLLQVTIGRVEGIRRLGLLLVDGVEVLGDLIENSQALVRKLVVCVCTALSMGGSGYVLWSWSAYEQMRFPPRRPEQAMPIFPLIGPCGDMEYWMLFTNTVVVVGVVTCCGLVWLVRRAK